MRLNLLTATLLLTVLLAGCNDSGPNGSNTTTGTQQPEPEVHYVYVNRTLNVTGTYSNSMAHNGFIEGPGNTNCVMFRGIGDAGLTALQVVAVGNNPSTIVAWELGATFPDARKYTAPSIEGSLPLTFNLTALEVEDQSWLYIHLWPADHQPSLAVRSPAALSIVLTVTTPEALYIYEQATRCGAARVV